MRIIELALSICALCLRPTFEKLFTGVNVWRRVGKIGAGGKTLYEIDPLSQILISVGHKNVRHNILQKLSAGIKKNQLKMDEC